MSPFQSSPFDLRLRNAAEGGLRASPVRSTLPAVPKLICFICGHVAAMAQSWSATTNPPGAASVFPSARRSATGHPRRCVCARSRRQQCGFRRNPGFAAVGSSASSGIGIRFGCGREQRFPGLPSGFGRGRNSASSGVASAFFGGLESTGNVNAPILSVGHAELLARCRDEIHFFENLLDQ